MRQGTDLVSVLDLLARPEWHRRAACRGMGPALFFGDRGENVQPAKDVCASCPVTEECLAAGLREKFGIWGGLSKRQRRRLRPGRTSGPGPVVSERRVLAILRSLAPHRRTLSEVARACGASKSESFQARLHRVADAHGIEIVDGRRSASRQLWTGGRAS